MCEGVNEYKINGHTWSSATMKRMRYSKNNSCENGGTTQMVTFWVLQIAAPPVAVEGL